MGFNSLRQKFINRIKHNPHSNKFTPLNDMFSYALPKSDWEM